MKNKTYGIVGEIVACDFLKKQGYKIIETNYTNKIGEIDIIAKKGDYIIFVEVKARTSKAFGLPRESVTLYKQNKIRQVAIFYLLKNKLTESNIRFDVIEILGKTIEHLQDCF